DRFGVAGVRCERDLGCEAGDRAYAGGVGCEPERQRAHVAECCCRQLEDCLRAAASVGGLECGFEASAADPVAAPEVADEVAPAVDPREPAAAVGREGYRAGAGGYDDPGSHSECADVGGERVVGEDYLACPPVALH